MHLKDKVVIISGIGPGLGIELARLSAREGAKVAISCRTESFLADSEKELKAAGADVLAQRCDIANEADCIALAEAVEARWGRIDALVNNAAKTTPFEAFEDADFAEWRANHDVNLIGSMQMARACVPAMKRAGGGSIVNVSSMAHKKPLPMQGAYASAKAGLEGATHHMALELGKYGIRVNTARMGWMDGPPVDAYLSGMAQMKGISEDEVRQPIIDGIALGKIPDDADCAKAVMFLCTDWAAVVSGAALDINGGEWMP